MRPRQPVKKAYEAAVKAFSERGRDTNRSGDGSGTREDDKRKLPHPNPVNRHQRRVNDRAVRLGIA